MNSKKNKKQILIVEDDLIIAMVLERMIEKLGFKVGNKVTTARDAITLAKTNSPDLILMDIQLKNKTDGITAMKEIRKYSSVPVIYITGNSDEFYLKKAKETRYVDYLVKPIQMEDLRKSIKKVF